MNDHQIQHTSFLDAQTRRSALQVGAVGALGLTLPQFLGMQAQAAGGSMGGTRGRAKSVINIYLSGGAAHQELWDPKPLASEEYRGPLGSVETAIKGEYFGEVLKKTAAVANKATIIRSMTHGEAAHERGTHNMWTGYRPSPALEYPSMGSVVSHELGVRNSLPPYIMIPKFPDNFAGANHAGSGYLSSSYAPFGLGSAPEAGNFKVRDLQVPEGVDQTRFDRRKGLLAAVDERFRNMEESDAIEAMDTFYQRAYDMISTKEAREAFDLNKEDKGLRDTYGRHAAGQRLVLARRLVEAGVRFVSVTLGGWDMHGNIAGGMKRQAVPLDQALAALITDLDKRGMLDETIVLVTSEFGRTPKINPGNGRDHWPRVFSVFAAGGGFSKGVIHGASDPLGGEPDRDPVTPEDLASTVYHLLGIDPHKRLMAPGDRPIDIVRGGNILEPIIG